jgi:hypothetical protein
MAEAELILHVGFRLSKLPSPKILSPSFNPLHRPSLYPVAASHPVSPSPVTRISGDEGQGCKGRVCKSQVSFLTFTETPCSAARAAYRVTNRRRTGGMGSGLEPRAHAALWHRVAVPQIGLCVCARSSCIAVLKRAEVPQCRSAEVPECRKEGACAASAERHVGQRMRPLGGHGGHAGHGVHGGHVGHASPGRLQTGVDVAVCMLTAPRRRVGDCGKRSAQAPARAKRAPKLVSGTLNGNRKEGGTRDTVPLNAKT